MERNSYDCFNICVLFTLPVIFFMTDFITKRDLGAEREI